MTQTHTPKLITEADVWRSGEGRTRPHESEIQSFNSRANSTREGGLKRLQEHRIEAVKTYTAKFGSAPEALTQAFDAARDYLSALPLIWWYTGTIKGSVSPIDTTGRGMFAIAQRAVPEIKAHMNALRGIVLGIATGAL